MAIISEEEYTKKITLEQLKLLKNHNLVFYCAECRTYHANYVHNSEPWIKINKILKASK